MGRKRKSEAATKLDEVDRSMYSNFCSAANSLSQLYSQAMNQQKISFQAGERHALGFESNRSIKIKMGRKRKSEAATKLDEVDRSMYPNFCSAANSLSQLYSQAMNQQKISFQAGERHALEKMHQWILRQHEEGSRVTAADVVSRIQNEIDYGGEELSVHFPTNGLQTSSTIFGQATVGLAPRLSYSDQSQTKNTVFANALSSPVCQNLQHYQHESISHVNRDSNSPSNDSSMDMRSDSPTHESY